LKFTESAALAAGCGRGEGNAQAIPGERCGRYRHRARRQNFS